MSCRLAYQQQTLKSPTNLEKSNLLNVFSFKNTSSTKTLRINDDPLVANSSSNRFNSQTFELKCHETLPSLKLIGWLEDIVRPIFRGEKCVPLGSELALKTALPSNCLNAQPLAQVAILKKNVGVFFFRFQISANGYIFGLGFDHGTPQIIVLFIRGS